MSLFLFPSAAESLCVGPFPLVVIAAEGNSADVRHDLNRELEGSHESGAETNFLKCIKRLRLDHETSFDGSTSIMFVCAETPRRGLYRRPRSKARKVSSRARSALWRLYCPPPCTSRELLHPGPGKQAKALVTFCAISFMGPAAGVAS